MKYEQSVLDDVEPGKRVKKVVDRVRGETPDMSQAVDMDDMGPAMMGRTPALGQLRRDRDIPVIRDNVPNLLD